MRERRDILRLWDESRDDGEGGVLATLVGVEGSSYRRVGARLLIATDGRYAGAISGGCLEAELMRKARWAVRAGAVMQRYSTLFDDTADIPYGLGCGGTVDVLLEPADTDECRRLMLAMRMSLAGIAQTVSTRLPGPGRSLGRSVSAVTVAEVDAPDVVTEMLRPPQRLVIVGAGDDAKPLVRLASLMGWDCDVVDGRDQWARRERFPEARSVAVVGDPVRFVVTPDDAVIIMTHSYEQDRDWLARVLPVAPVYLGLLGARHRGALLISETAAQLRWPVQRACHNLFAPVGLDLGGDGAEAIALATVAEIQACLEGKLGHSRRMTAAVVADQLQKGDASRYTQAQCAL